MKQKIQKYVIGVDGGGTKTEAALATLDGKILRVVRAGPSNLRNVGIKKAAENIAIAIKKVSIKRGKILSIFIGLAAIEEEFKVKKEKIKREIRKKLKFRGKLEIGSDQIVAFRSGTDEKNGIVLISGTGCVCHGWKNGKEAKTSGWGWLNDEGSGFWIGQKGFQAVFKELDGRGEKTLITKLVFKKWKLKDREDFLKRVYSEDSVRQVSLISRIVDEAAKKGDRIARKIMEEAGKELVFSAKKVIEKLNFKKEEFPVLLIGRVFESEIVLKIVKIEIKKIAPKAQFLIPQPKIDPVIGAVKLAIENFD